MAITETATYKQGAACIYCGKLVSDMTRDELIEFIGTLDATIARLYAGGFTPARLYAGGFTPAASINLDI